jgi:hypothetical protein
MKINKRALWMAKEDGNEVLVIDPSWHESWREATNADATLERMADMLDADAESINAHDFVCCHRGLAVVLFQELGRDKATTVMRRIANYRGLHGMLGVCGRTNPADAEKELGVSLSDWSLWSLEEK